MKTIKFTKNCMPYNAGEVATFADDTAAAYIAASVAEPHVADEAAPAATEQPKGKKQRP